MPISPEQSEHNRRMIEVEVEPDEEKECQACGNLLASESLGCSECSQNKIKLEWQKSHLNKETQH
ncbi:MAG TPA: hypothetical protein VMV71_02605 [Candidatus Paceibacterota bacterium]|nr:hypothetical protein [Candidatus Paceibacterota bacterium]